LVSKKKTKKINVPEHEIDVCDDKGEINLKIRIKIDWELKRYWIKKIQIDHKEI